MIARDFVAPLRQLHDLIRSAVVAAAERQSLEQLAGIEREDSSDTIYSIDAISEHTLVDFFEHLPLAAPIVLIAEGLPHGKLTFPRDSREEDAEWRIIIDPIDGTRGLMYQKRSGWILSGVAPNRGPQTGLQDIVAAVQTEIPLVKQHLSDQLWAIRNEGAWAERFNRLSGERRPVLLEPSSSDTIAHGFASISRFFPGSRAELASIDDEIAQGMLGPVEPGKAQCFEDQYISSGGQLYELMAGHDRFVADLRPLMGIHGICCHPYDLCTALIAAEIGVIVTDADGQPLDGPLDVTTELAWVGYANPALRARIEPLLAQALRKRGLKP